MKITLLFIFFAASVLAQTNTTQRDVNRSLQPTPKSINFEMLLATQQTRDILTRKLNGQYSKWDFSLLHTLNDQNEIRYFVSTRYIASDLIQDEFNWFLFETMYRRKNLFKDNSMGITTELELKNYWILDEQLKQMYGYNGSFIPQIIFNKRWKKGLSSELKLRKHFYHRNNPDNFTLSEEDRIYFTQSFFFQRRWMGNILFKYQHKIRKGDDLNYRFMPYFDQLVDFTAMGPDFTRFPKAKKHQEILSIHPGVMYFWNRTTLVEFYLETVLSDTYDKRSVNQIASDELVFGTAVYLSVF